MGNVDVDDMFGEDLVMVKLWFYLEKCFKGFFFIEGKRKWVIIIFLIYNFIILRIIFI